MLAVPCMPAVVLMMLAVMPLSAQHALVLSGGGARGLSHAGAIVALEEIGYRPSLVVGTSMGAIVGALYAAGNSSAQIRAIIAGENWLERFAAEPILIGASRLPRRPLVGFGINSNRFYGGFLSTTGINQRLVELLFDAGVRARNDFDDLPIRYRAVAADLATGAEFVIEHGDLPRAVRASMSVPGVFAPVRWGERVLIDGGVANNLPVSVARALSDEPVIAIDVLRPATHIEERGALDVGVRALRLLIENARPETGSNPDILVLPELEPGLAETGFPADASGVLRVGYEAVRQQVPPVPQQPDARRPAGAGPSRIGGLRVDGANPATERLIRRIMDGAAGAYDAGDIVRRTSALYMTGLFQSVWPRLEFDDDDADPTLVVDVTPVATTSVSAAARWDNDVGGGAWLSLRHGASANTPVELRLSGTIDELGNAGSLDGTFFSALVPGLRWNGGGHALEQRIRVIDNDTVAALLTTRRAGLWAGAELHGSVSDWFFSLLARADHIRGPGTRDGWAIGPFLRVARPPAPDRVIGADPLLEAEVRGGAIDYQRARLRVGHARSIGRASAAAFVELASSSANAPLDARPAAYRDMAPWLPAGALRRRHHAAFGIDGAVPIMFDGYARARVRALGTANDTDAFSDGAAWRLGGEAGAIWPTVLGPISVGVAAGQRSAWRLNLGVGTAF